MNMKPIYKFAFLLIGAASLLTSCEDGGEETIMLPTTTDAVVIESLSPAYGYPGDEFEIVGKNFGYASELLRVKMGEQSLKVLSATDDRIRVYVPVNATSAPVTVSLLGKEARSEELFKVLGQPSVETISRDWGFISDEVTFTGELLGTCAEDIKIYFGDSRVISTIKDWSETSFTAVIPADASTGRIRLTVHTKSVNTPIDVFTIRHHGQVNSISPSAIYAGNPFTIDGLYFGTSEDGGSVVIGGEEAEIISWEENTVVAAIPVGTALKAGTEYNVDVVTRYETIMGENTVTLRNAPVVSAMNPAEGYVGSSVKFSGVNLPDKAEDIVATVAGYEAVVSDYKVNAGDGTFSIAIPSGVATGKAEIQMSVGCLTFFTGNFTVLSTPALYKSDITLVKAGETVELKGENLGSSTAGIKATVAGVQAEIKNIQPDCITIVVPALDKNTFNAAVELHYPDTPVYSEAVLNVISGKGDITDMVLENANAPYTTAGDVVKNFATPTGWLFNDKMYFEGELIYPLLFDNDFPGGILGFWCHRWTDALHKHYIENGKIYQTVTLPAGDYEIVADVAECNIIAGDLGVALGVSDGELPDLTGAGSNFEPADISAYHQNPDGSHAYTMLSTEFFTRSVSVATPRLYSLKLSLVDRAKVTIGITGTATMRGGNGCSFELRSLKVNSL